MCERSEEKGEKAKLGTVGDARRKKAKNGMKHEYSLSSAEPLPLFTAALPYHMSFFLTVHSCRKMGNNAQTMLKLE